MTLSRSPKRSTSECLAHYLRYRTRRQRSLRCRSSLMGWQLAGSISDIGQSSSGEERVISLPIAEARRIGSDGMTAISSTRSHHVLSSASDARPQSANEGQLGPAGGALLMRQIQIVLHCRTYITHELQHASRGIPTIIQKLKTVLHSRTRERFCRKNYE